jgi:hypothetical protein
MTVSVRVTGPVAETPLVTKAVPFTTTAVVPLARPAVVTNPVALSVVIVIVVVASWPQTGVICVAVGRLVSVWMEKTRSVSGMHATAVAVAVAVVVSRLV